MGLGTAAGAGARWRPCSAGRARRCSRQPSAGWASGRTWPGVWTRRRSTSTLHIEDITRLIEYEGLDDVVLVGHAYAGMVITGVAEVCPERLSHLVYINGVIPSDGQSMADQLVPVRGLEFASWVRGHIERGGGYLPSPASPEEIGRRWGIPDAADREWMFSKVTPQPAAAMAGPVHIGNPAARDISRSFVGGAEAGFESVADRAREAGWGMYHLDSGHDPMVSHPRELAEILLGIGASF